MKKRIVGLLLCAVLLLSLLTMATAASPGFDNFKKAFDYTQGTFTDVPAGAWYESNIVLAYELGLAKGKSETEFVPSGSVTIAETLAFASRLHSIYSGGSGAFTQGSPWYQVYVDYARENGMITDSYDWNANATRAQFASILVNALPQEALMPINNVVFGSLPDVPANAGYASAVYTLYRAGVLTGNDEFGTFKPWSDIKRSEVATIIVRMAQPEQRKSLALEPGALPNVSVLTDDIEAELNATLAERINGILASETEIVHSNEFIPGQTYTGTAYYISNDGDDNNDGRSPETAWKTLQALVNHEDSGNLRPGDAVFFRRGDIFRMQDVGLMAINIRTEQLTLSAYGEGAKPIITMSSENGTGVEKWELVYEKDGVKIWQFYRDMLDTSMVVLNNGEAISTRVYEFWNGEGYISCEDSYWWMHDDRGVTLLDRLLPLNESMTENYNMISRPERFPSEHEGYGQYIDSGYGSLYLRCDEGNPGELFESIEFSERGGTILLLGGSDMVIDNLSIRGDNYIASHVPSEMDGIEAVANTVIQNCEFAYGGGNVTYYNGSDNGLYAVCPQGDGIYNVVKNTRIENNYFHDSMASAVTYEADTSFTDSCDGYFHVLDNVMVNTMGIRLDSTSERLQYLDSVIVRGNQIWNTGAMDNGRYLYSEGSIILMPNHYGECIIEENVLYTTENGHKLNGLIDTYIYSFEEFEGGYARPVFRNNTYVQYADRDFAYFMFQGENGESWRMDAPDLAEKVATLLGDTSSRFLIIK